MPVQVAITAVLPVQATPKPVIPAYAGIQSIAQNRVPDHAGAPTPKPVIPAHAGIQSIARSMDSRVRGNDGGKNAGMTVKKHGNDGEKTRERRKVRF
jgi:hypothetical protein